MIPEHIQTKIYLIRHGQTPWSVSKQHTGRTDIELTDFGKLEAKQLREGLRDVKFSKVYVSPLKRAQETCHLAGFQNPELADELYEWDYGDFEGLTTPQIREKNPNWNLFNDGVPNGETIDQVSQRADQIIQKASQFEGNVALFSSGHISRVIGARWLLLHPQNAQMLALSTASISILGHEHDWRVLYQWNNVSHLKELQGK